MKITTSNEDDFIYNYLLELLDQIKLVQGGSSIPPTLRRHKSIREYLIEKQKVKLGHIEETYFTDGELNGLAIENYHHKKSLQK